ncbi:crossover junction endodeoxyribonuclease RuvC [Nitrospira sp. BLG_1]|uniref:crossover junction endodeoxyribonuclease RuvC n=1 Tax=Nitrospira sp. BLG_1 TaxID=3395883 RepID=UPI0039BD3907
MKDKTVLGIDPGLACGWAVRSPSGTIQSGVWYLDGGRFEGAGMRLVRLTAYLTEIAKQKPFDVIAYEEVRSHMGVDAAHLYGAITLTIASWCEQHKVPYFGVSVGQVKKFATGNGGASKEMMQAAAKIKWPELGTIDHNEADARWIAEFAVSGKG